MFKEKLFISLQYLLPQHLLSRIIGKLASSKSKKLKNFLIKLFIKQYSINTKAALSDNLDDYNSFNDFFIRKLKPNLRPIASQQDQIISPADGNISQYGEISQGQLIQAKGKLFDIMSLLGGETDYHHKFKQGAFITVYLSPRDYHRVHMPYDGKLVAMTYVPGKLFSVNQTTAEYVPNLFSRNERVVCFFETSLGIMPVIFVGAFFVASIYLNWHGFVTPNRLGKTQHWDYKDQDISFKKGDELGYFQFGSTVITCFKANQVNFSNTLTNGGSIQMGQVIAETK
ncbi:archaetidylserine decarboxylase [Thiotrichales bacterium 19S11-10]|nr:archaetidylserine decarboxylase [Thiotrichales bacterium 19S11-10]MCF6807599.1 archaetidylserine decarboxylase [Thiotrichales bacterium 19S9-11]MCF6811568.1 archaetidylserine decarboxylase [Thiotrichales bacterium 19S9-12]